MEQSVRRLLSSATLINQAVGDALSDLLFCEAVLRLKGWGCKVGPQDKAASTLRVSHYHKLNLVALAQVACSR